MTTCNVYNSNSNHPILRNKSVQWLHHLMYQTECLTCTLTEGYITNPPFQSVMFSTKCAVFMSFVRLVLNQKIIWNENGNLRATFLQTLAPSGRYWNV